MFHAQNPQKALQELSSGIDGLSEKEAKIRLQRFGFNEIPEKKKYNPFLIFLKQFKSVMIYILFIAASISFFLGHLIDVYVILAIILINAAIGFIQEHRAERSIQALKKMIVPHAKVYREGKLIEINARELVPGDIISLEEGDRIPADCRLIKIKNLRTVEASLTGESFPVDKDIKLLPEKTPVADRKNMVFMGTFIAGGQAKAAITATGGNTEIGRVARDIEKIKIVKGHFQKKTDKLAKQMGAIAIACALLAFVIGFFVRGFDFVEIFLFTIAALVAGIPEGLAAVLAIVLAIGAHRMAKRNAIIRTLPATETLGVVTTIMTDKTGTLTENTMNVEKIIMPESGEITVSGSGWEPSGKFYLNEKIISPLENTHLSKLLHIAAVCNNAKILNEDEDGKNNYKIIGDPTEAALLVLAEKAGLKKEFMEKKERRIDDLPFNPELKYRASLSVLVEENKRKEIYVVGAPEAVLDYSSHVFKDKKPEEMNNEYKNNILSGIDSLTKNAMRVLALAYKEVPAETGILSEEQVNNLIFVGIVGIRDPPRPGVKDSIEKAKNAGIRVIMATGDHKGTALAIAKEIGINADEALTEQELKDLPEKEFQETVKNFSVFARLTPNMKLKIAETLQGQGHIVAMTGDGVNDAPALKKADIGISMGLIGTDVARESGEIVLADDNFASIVNAIEEGRIVFTNTRQVSFFLITTNFAESVTIISSLLISPYLPLLPTQILWLNLVSDGLPVVALSTEQGHGDVLQEPPRDATEDILSKDIMPFLILITGIMVAAALFIFTSYLPQGIDKARTGAFCVMTLTQFFNVFNLRSLKKSCFEIGFFSNKYINVSLLISVILLFMVIYIPFFQDAFHFAPLSLTELLTITLLSSLVLVFGEVYKFARK